MKGLATIGTLLLAGTLLPAAGVAQVAEKTWDGEAALGIVATKGNTNTRNVNAKARVSTDRTRWLHTVNFEAYGSSDEDVTTAERYLLKEKSDYKIQGSSYLFVTVGYDNDRFAGYDYRTTEAIGYGREAIKRPDLSLKVEGGVGARQTQSTAAGASLDNEGTLNLGGLLKWDANQYVVLSEDLGSEIGESTTISKSVTTLKSKINGNLASQVTLTVKVTDPVPAGIKETEMETAVSLVYDF